MDLAGATLGCGGGEVNRPPSLKSLHISHNNETWHSYTSPKEDMNMRRYEYMKIYDSRDIPLEFY